MKHRFWRAHAARPLAAFAALAALGAFTQADPWVAHTLFFDEAHMRWLGQDSLLVNGVIHTGGRWFIRVLILLALAIWVAAHRVPAARPLQRAAGYLALSMLLSVGAVGLLKMVTNVDCPWDLREFGGVRPFVALLAHRPHGLGAGRCFPAAHASAGYALVAFYFVLREFRRAWRRGALVAASGAGLVFGLAQQARGAHFWSHDLWSAGIVWIIALTVYVYVFDARLLYRATPVPDPPELHVVPASTHRLAARRPDELSERASRDARPARGGCAR
jgi:membrane-associated PAP2 superfamily phosphatase